MRHQVILGFTFFICFIYNSAYSQVADLHVNFSSNFGGTEEEEFFGGSQCADGGFIMAGLSPSNDYDLNQVSYDSANVFIVRCDKNGEKIWARTYGGNGYDKARYAIEDSDGNILVVGGTRSSDGDVTTFKGSSDLFVTKLDPSGNIIWFKTYGGSAFEGGRYITETANGGYAFCGYTTSDDIDITDGGRGAHDGWITRLDRDGNIIWSKTFGGSHIDRIRSMKELPDGSLVFTGSSQSNDGDCSGNHGLIDYWSGRVDSLGNLMWCKLYGGSDIERSYHLSLTQDGNAFITGNSLSVDGDVSSAHGLYDGWILKIDINNGAILWNRAFGGSKRDYMFRTLETPDGGFVAAGSTTSIDHDVADLGCDTGDSFWLIKYDDNYDLQWHYCVGGSKSDICNDLAFTADSGYVMMGDSKSNDGATSGNYGSYDFWILKLNFENIPGELENPLGFSAYYNIIENTIEVKSNSNQELYISLYNTAGSNIILDTTISLTQGKNSIQMQDLISVRTKGIFYAVLFNAENKLTIKIPVVK